MQKVTILSCMTSTFSIRDFIILITLILTLYSEISDIHISSIGCFYLLKFTVYFLPFFKSKTFNVLLKKLITNETVVTELNNFFDVKC